MYQVLYRKYRPQTFFDVVGQEHITKTLAHEVAQNKMSHAYLFTGTRGTGKTTCAKILSKAVNCLNPINGDPCNECEICRGLDDGSILDVVEIDAASNNGVDNIRDIRDESNFSPVSCKYRVYIIDEVHMLSIGAFNALLKTLEEPPAHVKFILATTEVHKLPVTIISRCQRFDFKKVNANDMVGRMQYIAGKEDFELENDAAMLISRLSDGGVRDALSLLDQCAGISKVITDETVTQVAGLTGKAHLFELAKLSNENETAQLIELISNLYENSIDMERLSTDLINHYRNLMIVKTVKNSDNLLVCTKEELADYINQASTLTLESILYNIDLFSTALGNIKRGVDRRIEIEMTFVKSSNPQANASNEALLKRISQLETMLRQGNFTAAQTQAAPAVVQVAAPPTTPTASVKQEAEQIEQAPPWEEQTPTPQPAPVYETPQPQIEQPPQPSYEQPPQQMQQEPQPRAMQNESDLVQKLDWSLVLNELMAINMPIWGVLIGSSAYISNDFVLVQSVNPTFASFIRTGTNARDVKEAIFRVTGKKYRLGVSKNEAPSKKEPQKDALDGFLETAKGLGIKTTLE
ncbi:MAG: DNA polymerase III subunit gamma/tau [Clostridia bacterium]